MSGVLSLRLKPCPVRVSRKGKGHNIVHRRVEILDAFYDSLEALDGSEATIRAVQTLMYLARNDPEGSPPAPGQFVRVIKTCSSAELTALRLFYYLDADGIHIVHIEPYDELAL